MQSHRVPAETSAGNRPPTRPPRGVTDSLRRLGVPTLQRLAGNIAVVALLDPAGRGANESSPRLTVPCSDPSRAEGSAARRYRFKAGGGSGTGSASAGSFVREPDDRALVAQRQSPQPSRSPTAPDTTAALADMTRGFSVNDRLRDRLRAGLQAFSPSQLEKMQRAGVRFWGSHGLPPGFSGVEAPTLTSPAAFIPGVRIIRVGSRTNPHAVRHELAHAWDYVQGLARLQRLDDLAPAQRLRALVREAERPPGRSGSGHMFPVATPAGRQRLTFRRMYDRYVQRVRATGRPREEAFDGPSTAEGHSMRSPREFYAEGYAVFHGHSAPSKRRLQEYAPELHSYLEAEASREGIAQPGSSAHSSRAGTYPDRRQPRTAPP